MTRLLAGPAVLGFLLLPAPAVAANDAIQKAIDRGVTYLKSIQKDGVWPQVDLGSTALAALTLLECKVPADDPVLVKATRHIREQCIGSTHTYSIALSILFFDRLGDPGDLPLLESLTVRLLAGQNSHGGWSYDCPPLAANEVERLLRTVKQRNELIAADLKKPPEGKRTFRDLPREIQEQLTLVHRAGPFWGEGNPGDNSNTQFATLALWVARRHGLPVDRAVARIEARFRTSQNADGGWSYFYMAAGPGPVAVIHDGSSAAMTCAGLLGLAVGQGAAQEAAVQKDPKAKPRDLGRDVNIRAGLAALSTAVGHPVAKLGGRGAIPILGRAGKHYYYLWSLERVMVVFGLETLGDKDWYAWGAEILLANQLEDGSWQGDYSAGGADTCFALLFLRRSNFATDLTASLRGRVQDPGQAVLRAGGVGGDNLHRLAVKPGIDANAKPGNDGSYKDKPPPAADPKTKPVLAATGEVEAARLGADLVQADGARQERALDQLRDGKGVAFTDALADAVVKLKGPAKNKAREALAERLAGMTAETLAGKLLDGHLEVRRAAALACAMKEEKGHVPRLIELLEDPEPAVARAALAALKSLSGRDFGPGPDTSPAERANAVAAWKTWWKKQSGK
jgi:hypothetical protein